MKREEINNIMESLGLGSVVSDPTQVTGGLLHKMYRVNSDKGTYAVKVLNPEIMKRPVALQNTVNSEKIATGFRAIIPVVSALEIDEKQIHELGGSYYMVFDWVEGTSIFPPKITTENCSAIGEVLGKIHSANLNIEEVSPGEGETKMFAWDKYGESLQGYETEGWASRLMKALPDVKAWNQAACDAREILTKTMVISHRDLDPKNVLWNDNTPWIIDWEAAGYVNPYQELLEVLNYWADDGKGDLLKVHFDALLASYTKYVKLETVDWEAVFAGSYMGMLGWLEYNVKRALALEAETADDILLGKEQVLSTTRALYHYQEKIQWLKKYLTLPL